MTLRASGCCCCVSRGVGSACLREMYGCGEAAWCRPCAGVACCCCEPLLTTPGLIRIKWCCLSFFPRSSLARECACCLACMRVNASRTLLCWPWCVFRGGGCIRSARVCGGCVVCRVCALWLIWLRLWCAARALMTTTNESAVVPAACSVCCVYWVLLAQRVRV